MSAIKSFLCLAFIIFHASAYYVRYEPKANPYLDIIRNILKRQLEGNVNIMARPSDPGVVVATHVPNVTRIPECDPTADDDDDCKMQKRKNKKQWDRKTVENGLSRRDLLKIIDILDYEK